MTRIAIQLSTLRGLDESVTEKLDRVSATALDGVEFSGMTDAQLEDVASALERTDLTPVAVHVEFADLEAEPAALVDAYGRLDCTRFVVSDVGQDPFASASAATESARRLSGVGDRLAEEGFELLYDVDFSALTDEASMDAFDAFVDALSPSVGLQVDTGLATYEGVDPVDFIERYPDAVPLVHLTDAAPGADSTRRVELGAGEVDLERCVRAAQSTDVEWLIYEHKQTNDPVDSLTHAATMLPQLWERTKTSKV